MALWWCNETTLQWLWLMISDWSGPDSAGLGLWEVDRPPGQDHLCEWSCVSRGPEWEPRLHTPGLR